MTFALYSPTLASMSRYDKPSHTVYMTFFSRQGWQVQFAEADLRTFCPGCSPLRTLRRSESLHGAGSLGRCWSMGKKQAGAALPFKEMIQAREEVYGEPIQSGLQAR